MTRRLSSSRKQSTNPGPTASGTEAYSRTPSQAAAVACATGGTCSACQQICPRSVPLLEIFAFTRRKLAQVDAA